MITIVDYQMGNIGSLINMFHYIGEEVCVTSNPRDLVAAEKLVLPGVGAFDVAMNRINSSEGLREALETRVLGEQTPILGICLGMQLFTESSQEGVTKGLGWIPGRTLKFVPSGEDKVPHMGWNHVKVVNPSPLTADLSEESRFYFVHSYYVEATSQNNQMLRTTHGIEFDSAVCHNNIFGVQFHPEKSLRFGISLLRAFARL